MKTVIFREAKPSGGSDGNAGATDAGGVVSIVRFSRLPLVGGRQFSESSVSDYSHSGNMAIPSPRHQESHVPYIRSRGPGLNGIAQRLE